MHDKSAKVYNSHSKQVSFKVGQEVFHRNFAQSNFVQGINAKLLPKFLKSRFRKVVGNCMYELETQNRKLIGIFHAKDIRQ